MKKVIVLSCSVLIMVSCKDKSVEVKVDETKVETAIDSIVEKDTIAAIEETAATEISTSQMTEKKVAAAKSGIKVKMNPDVEVSYASFGQTINATKALSKDEMLKKYALLKTGDTVAVKFKSKINSVCKKKGCWMKMDLANEKESFVRFTDYEFFVPLDAENSEAVVSGRAFIDVISVDELKHYAKDGGKTVDEINKIVEPKITYAFQADGVLIQQ